MKKITVGAFMLVVLICVTVINPAVAQTADEILADGRGEAVQVISETAFSIWALIVGALVVLAGIVTLTALRFVYRSTPEWAHGAMIAVADKAISTLQAFADKTNFTDIDDKVTLAVRDVFDNFIDEFLTKGVAREIENPPPANVNTSADDKSIQ